MATILIYNNNSGRMETYSREESSPMPYNTGGTLLVTEFRGASTSSILYTERRVMELWNAFRSYFGAPIPVRYAFKRIWEGGHGITSQHYAGSAFDTGQALSPTERRRLYDAAVSFGRWGYVEPRELTPTWVHFDARQLPTACGIVSYPIIRNGSRGSYVLVLQDALAALGYDWGGLDGYFGSDTQRAVQTYQRDNNLAADGIVGCSTWYSICSRAKGIGRTNTVIRP